MNEAIRIARDLHPALGLDDHENNGLDGVMGTQRDTTAGCSARREYERRRANDEARIRDKWGQGKLGSIAIALTDEKQSTKAWKSGAEGEAQVGRALDSIASEHLVVLHDRRIPGSRANIDHIAITRGGVWVVDAKRYRDKRPELRVEGGLFRPRVEKLIVGGDRTRLVDSAIKQRDLVRAVVGTVPVTAALCFVDADWPTFGGSFATRGVEILWRKKLVKTLLATRGTVDVRTVAAAIATHFPPA